jgi:hypothetical protein
MFVCWDCQNKNTRLKILFFSVRAFLANVTGT